MHPDPAAIGLPAEEVQIEVDGGTAPAWLVRATPADVPAGTPSSDVWAIMVHGRGATRQEGLRAVRVARDLGLSSLLISYRNDGLAPSPRMAGTVWVPPSGMTWRRRSVTRWTMAPAKWCFLAGPWRCNLPADRGFVPLPPPDPAMVLDAPVINWVNVLAHHAELNRIPSAVGRYGQLMMSHRLGRRLTGLAAPVDLKAMDWVSPPWSCGRRR